jgi:hypothetical protein
MMSIPLSDFIEVYGEPIEGKPGFVRLPDGFYTITSDERGVPTVRDFHVPPEGVN